MEAIDLIRKHADLVEIVREHTKFRKRGNEWFADCPFCKAKNTFIVDTKNSLFHCYGCGQGGDVFTFVMEKLNLSFPEALKWLQEKCGLRDIKDIEYGCLLKNVCDLQKELALCFSHWMKEEIKDKEFIYRMTQLIKRLADMDRNEIPFLV